MNCAKRGEQGAPSRPDRADHIKAHFLICFIALVIARILEIKVLKGKYPSSRIIENLRKELGIDFNRKYMSLGEIKGILGKTKQTEA